MNRILRCFLRPIARKPRILRWFMPNLSMKNRFSDRRKPRILRGFLEKNIKKTRKRKNEKNIKKKPVLAWNGKRVQFYKA